MSQFRETLRERVEDAVRDAGVARDGGNDLGAEFHLARLTELLELAARHGVDTRNWVEDAAVAALVMSEQL